ncbi:hypothetical protein FACS189413_05900 [Bacteroidia bacterium]|nr:hypothetical protein FACS189413_05900 [Bacteroidia bacterium]
MNTKKISITIICLLFACQIFALGNRFESRDNASAKTTFNERTEKWLQRSGEGEESSNGSLRGFIGTNETANGENSVGSPISDAFPVVLLLSGIYFYFIAKRKQKTA